MRQISKVTIILGVVIYLISRILLSSVPPFDPTSKVPWQGSKLNILAVFGLSMALSTMTVSGFRSIRKIGIRWSNVFLSLVGVGMTLTFILVNYQAYTLLSNSHLSNKNAESLEQVASILAKDMPLESKAQLSLMYSQMKFQYDGVKIKYVDPRGNLVDFEPSAEDIENRNVQIKLVEQAAWGKKYPLQSAVYWAVAAIVSLIISVLTPVKRDKVTAT